MPRTPGCLVYRAATSETQVYVVFSRSDNGGSGDAGGVWRCGAARATRSPH